VAFVIGDVAAERFGGALDLFGIHVHARQFVHQLTALSEADHRAQQAHHAQNTRRQ